MKASPFLLLIVLAPVAVTACEESGGFSPDDRIFASRLCDELDQTLSAIYAQPRTTSVGGSEPKPEKGRYEVRLHVSLETAKKWSGRNDTDRAPGVQVIDGIIAAIHADHPKDKAIVTVTSSRKGDVDRVIATRATPASPTEYVYRDDPATYKGVVIKRP